MTMITIINPIENFVQLRPLTFRKKKKVTIKQMIPIKYIIINANCTLLSACDIISPHGFILQQALIVNQ